MQRQMKHYMKTLQVYAKILCCSKKKFGGVQTKSLVGPVGCLGHPQAYCLHHSCIELSLVFLHSLWKNFNTKLSPISFSMSDISKTMIIQTAIESFKNFILSCPWGKFHDIHSPNLKRSKKNQVETLKDA